MIKKTLKTIGITVLILILLLTIAAVVGSVFRDEMLLSPWGTGLFVIASGSMEPTIPDGSIILVGSVPEDDISVDDVITFFSGSRTYVVTHRVKHIIEDEDGILFTTRGDANNADDPSITYDRVIGRVIYTIPGSGFIVKALGNAVYVGVAIIFIGLALCVSAVVSTVSKRKKAAVKTSDEDQKVDTNADSDGNYPSIDSSAELINSEIDGSEENGEGDFKNGPKEVGSDETKISEYEKDEKE